MTTIQRILAALAGLVLATSACYAQQVGECITLFPKRPDLGVPIHDIAGQNSFRGERLAVDAVVEVLEIDPPSGWLRVDDGVQQGWISTRYIGEVVPCDFEPSSQSRAVAVVGTWNLEWFKDGASRGFPEFRDADAINPRSIDDYAFIADLILTLDLDVLLLQEINAEDITHGEEVARVAPEMDRLVDLLNAKAGADAFEYVVGSTGRSQRLAILWDNRVAGLNWWCEPALADERVNGKQLFDRQPILAYFSLFEDGAEMNDLVVVDVHLASGQDNARNHDLAMARLVAWIIAERAADGCIPINEADVLIGGDFNANRFGGAREDFWDDFEANGWDILADFGSGYPGTRLAGDPPGRTQSVLDYIIVSDGGGGLQGDEISMRTAAVRLDLLDHPEIDGDGMVFRERASDHLPITIDIAITIDRD